VLVRAGAPAIIAAERFRDRLAVRDHNRELTFGELDNEANALADSLARIGVRPGERVAVLAHNRTEFVAAWLACERAGLVRVVLHSHFDISLHVELVHAVGARAILFDARFSEQIAGCRDELAEVDHMIAVGEPCPEWASPYGELLAAGSGEFPALDVEEDSPVCIQPTTGTTGRPKPWVVSHRSWRALVAHNLEHLDTLCDGALGGDDTNLHVHALQWASGAQTLLPYLLRGAPNVLVDDASFEPALIADAIEAEQATGVLIPGPMLNMVLDEIAGRAQFEHRLRRLVTLFATPELLGRASELLGPVWCHGYGATEQGAPATRLTAAEAAANGSHLGSVGRPASPSLELRVVDAAGRDLARGQTGEIVVRSAMSTSSYWHEDELSAAAYLPGGWFRSRDLGYLDDEGFLFYIDRAQDAIETAAGSVYPHEVENAVLGHPAVAGCGAVGLGPAGEQEVIAAVELKPGYEDAEQITAEITVLAAGLLTEHARPRVMIVSELPTVLGGAKVQREVLRARLAAGEPVA